MCCSLNGTSEVLVGVVVVLHVVLVAQQAPLPTTTALETRIQRKLTLKLYPSWAAKVALNLWTSLKAWDCS